MVWFKSCPRCLEGDLADNRDMYGPYVVCLRCAHYLTDSETAAPTDRCLRGVVSLRGPVAARDSQALRSVS